MAPKGKSPLRSITKLGLDQLLNQIVAQASNQGPPTGTTTIPGQVQPQAPTTPRLDANGDRFVAEGLPPGATPGNQAAPPQAGPAPATQPSPAPGTTTTLPTPTALSPTYSPVNGQAPAAPVNGTSAAPASAAPTSSTYRNIGEIFAEQPPSDDPQSMFNFQRERLNKIGRFYGLSDEELQQAQANVSGMLGMAVQEPGMSPVKAQSLANQMFQAEGTKIIQAHDKGNYDMQNSGPGGTPTPTFTGTDPNAPTSTFGEDNPLSVYGVYTPEQIAAIQGQIGQYVNQYQDRFSQAAGGWKPSPAMQDAYARQAQAIPAVQALEGQAALAQALAAEKEKNAYYTTLLDQRSSDASGSGSSGGSMSDEDMTAFVNSLTGG